MYGEMLREMEMRGSKMGGMPLSHDVLIIRPYKIQLFCIHRPVSLLPRVQPLGGMGRGWAIDTWGYAPVLL